MPGSREPRKPEQGTAKTAFKLANVGRQIISEEEVSRLSEELSTPGRIFFGPSHHFLLDPRQFLPGPPFSGRPGTRFGQPSQLWCCPFGLSQLVDQELGHLPASQDFLALGEVRILQAAPKPMEGLFGLP